MLKEARQFARVLLPTRTRASLRRLVDVVFAPAWLRPIGRRSFPTCGLDSAPVTQTLHARLTPGDIAAIDRHVEDHDPSVLIPVAPAPELRFTSVSALSSAASEVDRRRIALAMGTHARIPGVLESTGLRFDEPPEDVHSMARGPLSAGGSIYHADLVVAALQGAGVEIGRLSVLDFGCSSGRVVRVLQAAYPDVEWHGWDPNRDAVAWAGAHLPGIAFRSGADEPPLPYADASFDLVYAISIWSHLRSHAALRWLGEMHRIVRPGGHLLLTANGLTALSRSVAQGILGEYDARSFREELADRGFAFDTTFATHPGRSPQLSTELGDAYLTPEWLLTHACPAWQIVDYGAGRNEGNQDVYVMRRS